MNEITITAADREQGEALGRIITAPGLETIDVCATWHKIKPFWPWIIKVVTMIPSVGQVIAKVLEFVGNALDAFCTKK